MADAAVDLSIVICTFHRETLLARALASVIAQRRPDDFRFDVIVVDNSDSGTAAPVIEAARLTAPFAIRALAAHPANISVARNAGVAATSATWIAFVDDDQALEPDWLVHVARAVASTPHDVLFGAIDTEFEAPERATPATRKLFTRGIDAPSGDDLFALGPRKTRDIALSTANAMFRRATTFHELAPFDLAFGAGGGEDYDLLCRLERDGRCFGWLPGAKAREFVPASRCEPSYLLLRFYAGGQAFAAAAAGASARPRATRWRLRGRALVQAGWLLMQAPFALHGSAARRDHAYRWAGAFGKLSIGGILPIYQRTEAPTPAPRSARVNPGFLTKI